MKNWKMLAAAVVLGLAFSTGWIAAAPNPHPHPTGPVNGCNALAAVLTVSGTALAAVCNP